MMVFIDQLRLAVKERKNDSWFTFQFGTQAEDFLDWSSKLNE